MPGDGKELRQAIAGEDNEHPWRTPLSSGPVLPDITKSSGNAGSAAKSATTTAGPKKSTAPRREDYPLGLAGDLAHRKAIHAYGAEGIAHGDDK